MPKQWIRNETGFNPTFAGPIFPFGYVQLGAFTNTATLLRRIVWRRWKVEYFDNVASTILPDIDYRGISIEGIVRTSGPNPASPVFPLSPKGNPNQVYLHRRLIDWAPLVQIGNGTTVFTTSADQGAMDDSTHHAVDRTPGMTSWLWYVFEIDMPTNVPNFLTDCGFWLSHDTYYQS